MDKQQAQSLATQYAIPLNVDFHTLDSDTVERVLAAARLVKYRQPRNANGSKARYFHARLVRIAARNE